MRNAKIGPDLRLVQIPAGLLPVFFVVVVFVFFVHRIFTLSLVSLYSI